MNFLDAFLYRYHDYIDQISKDEPSLIPINALIWRTSTDIINNSSDDRSISIGFFGQSRAFLSDLLHQLLLIHQQRPANHASHLNEMLIESRIVLQVLFNQVLQGQKSVRNVQNLGRFTSILCKISEITRTFRRNSLKTSLFSPKESGNTIPTVDFSFSPTLSSQDWIVASAQKQ